MPETPITFERVEVVRVTDMGLSCLIDGRSIFVGIAVPMSGTTIRAAGDVGRLVLPRWFAQDQGLPIH